MRGRKARLDSPCSPARRRAAPRTLWRGPPWRSASPASRGRASATASRRRAPSTAEGTPGAPEKREGGKEIRRREPAANEQMEKGVGGEGVRGDVKSTEGGTPETPGKGGGDRENAGEQAANDLDGAGVGRRDDFGSTCHRERTSTSPGKATGNQPTPRLSLKRPGMTSSYC